MSDLSAAAEERLGEEPGGFAGEQRYRALVEAIAADVWRASPDGSLLTDLPRWRATSRQTREEVLGDGWARAVHPQDAARVLRAWRRATEAAGVYEVEYRIRPVRGSVTDDDERALAVRGVPVRDASGAVVEYLGLTVDVTERRREDRERETLGRRLSDVVARMVRLQRLTARLSGAVDVRGIAEAVLDEARSGLGAAGGGVSLLDETGTRLRYQALDGYDPDVKAVWSDISLTTPSPGTVVLTTGTPMFLSHPDELLRRFPTEAMRQFVDASQERSWVRLPLRTSGQPFGVLALGWSEEREWDEEERAFLHALAGLSAQALERADAYERERQNAVLLQQSLLPDRLPDVDGVQVRGAYRAGESGLAVGGDWYDAFVLPDGCVGLAVGDVRGKGVAAASVMGRVRAALRAYALLDPDPATVLSRLDLFLEEFDDPEEIVTLAYGVLDTRAGVPRHSSAGHPPVLLHEQGTARALEGGRDLPLGVGRPVRSTATQPMVVGSTLVMVTDGLLDERHLSLTDAIAVLIRTIEEAAADGTSQVDTLPDHLVRRLTGERPDDDATVLAVQLQARDAGARAASVRLSGSPRSAGEARGFVRSTLQGWGVGHLEDVAVLLVSELVTNAVVHARSDAELRLGLQRSRLRVSVTDRAGQLEPRPRQADETATNGRGLALVGALASEWGATVADPDGGKTVWFELAVDDPDPV